MALFEAKEVGASYSHAGEGGGLLSAVSFALEEGRVYDLIGPSGSGKSTLLRVCALMMERTGGTLLLQGKESGQFAPTAWRRQVCLVPQIPTLIPSTVRANLVLPWRLKVRAGEAPPDDEALLGLLERGGLAGIGLDRDASQLSGGQAARVALLRAFAAKPCVMLLDEVDAALDDESAHAIGRLTHSLVGTGITCLRVRHRKADGFASGVFRLKEGTLSYSDPDSDSAAGRP